MHDDPALYPHLPLKPIDAREREIMLDPVEGTEWQTCWEYVLSHHLTDREGSAFWHGANLAFEAMRDKLSAVSTHHNRVPSDSPFNSEGRDVCGTCMDGHVPADWPCPTAAVVRACIRLHDRESETR